jgi:acyl-CoA synthetase (AMP-forming)/AMP-acid ligase II
VVLSRETASDGVALAAELAASGATVLQATPATWRLLIEANWQPPAGFRILSGGEALSSDLAMHLAGRAETWNLYGPTETTVWSSRECINANPSSVTIGRPIANTDMYVLDAALRPVPVGIAGELFIGGEGLARGYLGRPGLTAERFVPHPFAAKPGARLYRTGDLARFLPDGRLEWIARIDHQVKIRGHRIELGEIEAVVGTHKSVKQVVVFPAGAGDERRLVAYVVLNPGEPLTVSELRRVAKDRLPSYMVPSFFLKLGQIPLTPNGKVDRRALPDPFSTGSRSESSRVPPSTDTERRLAAIWQQVLGGNEAIGAHDNFFDIGGHSLLSMRVIAEIQNVFGKRLNPRVMFRETLAQIAARCDREDADRPGKSEDLMRASAVAGPAL